MSAPATEATRAEQARRSGIAKWIRRLSVPIIIGWVALIGVLNLSVPQLEEVGKMQAVSMSPKEAPSVAAMMRIGKVFEEFDSDSSAMIVLEGDAPLGEDAHRFYDDMIAKLRADTKHVQHIQDFWGDPLTRAGAQSEDGKAAYVQVYLAGNMGEALGNESVIAAQKLVDGLTPPPGVKVYVTGGPALQADQENAGNASIRTIEFVTVGVIITMLLFFYRSIVTVLLVLTIMVLSLSVTRGVVAVLGYNDLIGLSTFATQLLVTLAIAATTDYAIFLIGRYQEARSVGEDKESAYYTMFHGTAHVVLGSGMTIAGATFCLSFTRLPYFQSLGIPLAVGMVVAVLVALTLGPAIITVASRFGLLEPKRAMRIRFWRRIGAAVVRWPGGILTATILLALIGLLTLPGYRPSYNDRLYLPDDLPSQQGFAAAERHFPVSRMNPEMLLVETDKDLRNSADFLVIEKITKAVTKVPGIGRVQSITRPEGKPLKFSTIPSQMSMNGTLQELNRSYSDRSMDDMLTQANEMQTTIDAMTKMSALMGEMTATTHSMVERIRETTIDTMELRDNIADFDDFFRPVRNYLYWEPHCYDIPVCHTLRAIFDALDGTDALTDDIQSLLPDLERLDTLMPQLQTMLPPQIESMKRMRDMMLTMHSTQSSQQDQQYAMSDGQSAMGDAFNDSHNDDTFYLPPEIFDNKDFKTRHEELHLPRRPRGPVHHLPRERPAGRRRNRAHRRHQERCVRSHQGHAVGRIAGLPRRHRIHLQGHAGRQQLRPADRRRLRDGADLHRHAAHHAQRRRGRRDRRHRHLVARRIVRAVGSVLAAPDGLGPRVHGDGDGGHHPVGGRRGLQPAAGGSDEGGDTGRDQHRNHPRHGRQRIRRDRGGPGVRVHHDVDVGERHGGGRPDGHDHRDGSVVRHIGDPGVHDAVHRGAARPVVLVAADRACSTGEPAVR